MDVTLKKKRNGLHSITVKGDLTIYEALEFKEKLVESLEKCKGLEMDLSHVEEFDTAGFQLLVLAKREMSEADKPFSITGTSEAVQEVLEIYRMEKCFSGQQGDSVDGATDEGAVA